MYGSFRFAVGTAIIALASVVISPSSARSAEGSSGGPTILPSPPPAATPIDTNGWLPFTSARHGFSLRYPPDWIARTATAPWIHGDPVDHDLPNDRATDELDGPVDGAFWLASQAIPPAAASADPGDASDPACWPPIADWSQVPLADTVARYHGGPGCGFWETQIVDGGRLYAFAANGRVPLEMYLAVMPTVVLDPTAADDTPASTPAPLPVSRIRASRDPSRSGHQPDTARPRLDPADRPPSSWWSGRRDLNPQPRAPKARALPIALRPDGFVLRNRT